MKKIWTLLGWAGLVLVVVAGLGERAAAEEQSVLLDIAGCHT